MLLAPGAAVPPSTTRAGCAIAALRLLASVPCLHRRRFLDRGGHWCRYWSGGDSMRARHRLGHKLDLKRGPGGGRRKGYWSIIEDLLLLRARVAKVVRRGMDGGRYPGAEGDELSNETHLVRPADLE